MREELEEFMRESQIDIPAEGYEKFEAYHRVLLEWNAKIDLTNVPEEEMALRHYAESLLALTVKDLFRPSASVIDIGSGAGFPGLPLAIARPDIRIVLLDSLGKRCDFLRDVCSRVGISSVIVLHARAEDAAVGPYREVFDLATARALAPLPVLAEYMLPFLKIGGKALCWKGPAILNEIAQARTACGILGGLVGELVELPIPGRRSYIQIMDKTRRTIKKYPRRAGLPTKSTLGQDPAML